MNLCRDLREMLGYSQTEWAKWMGCSNKTISRWEVDGMPANLARQVMNGIYEAIEVAGLAKVRERVRWGTTNLVFHSITGWHLQGLPLDVAEPFPENEEEQSDGSASPPQPSQKDRFGREIYPKPRPGCDSARR